MGRLLTLVNSASAIGFGYDDANELASETTTLPGQAAATVSYTYDVDGNRATMTTPAGSVIQYGYTGRNQVASITADGPPALATYAYDLAGNRIGRTLENNTATAYQYDIANRLLNVAHTSGGNALGGYGYGLNAVGNRTSRTETTGTNAPGQDTYNYDAVDQLTGVSYASSRTVTYNYDYVGNRTSVIDTGTTTSYAVNNVNQYTRVGAQPVLGYDGNGNLNNNYTGWTYSYDAQNRLVSGSAMVTGTSGSSTLVTAAFAYDARNRCVSRTINGVTTNLYYDGWNLIEERDASGALGSRYVHGTTTDEMLAKLDGTRALYYHQDGLGSTVALSDDSGAAVERYTYDAFGAPTICDAFSAPLTVSAYGNRFLYTGREWIAELSLYDYRNRVYSAELGRFLQTDPIRFEGQDVNIYRYVFNDPTKWIDSLGLRLSYQSHCSTCIFWRNYGYRYGVPAAYIAALAADMEQNDGVPKGISTNLAIQITQQLGINDGSTAYTVSFEMNVENKNGNWTATATPAATETWSKQQVSGNQLGPEKPFAPPSKK